MFGNGTPWSSFLNDSNASHDSLGARWFLVVHPPRRAGAGAFADDPTATFDAAGAAAVSVERVVFRVLRKRLSKFDFVSIGRNPGNDICFPDDSISRFHAYLRDVGAGLVVVDAGSQNGTFLSGARLPAKAEPTAVCSGDSLRFGDVPAQAFDVDGLLALIRAERAASGAIVS